ncbi:hypothetical protein NicSoilE8_43070 (plasmid) [Arthrobacter sp. NicSoilE8]|nr:hypothetical protein NicSoilE8_43070 [Arthrobacter sp. NicSoilE8]
MDDESRRFKTNTIITVDDGTQPTGCTQPPRHPRLKPHPEGAVAAHSLHPPVVTQTADLPMGQGLRCRPTRQSLMGFFSNRDNDYL